MGLNLHVTRQCTLALIGCVLTLLGGCASQVSDDATVELTGVRWELVSWSDHEIPRGDHAGTVVLTFQSGTQASVSGRAGCNQFEAPYVLRDLLPGGARLTIGHAAATRMQCESKAMDFEEAFLDELQALGSYRIHGQTLELLGMDGRIMCLQAREKIASP